MSGLRHRTGLGVLALVGLAIGLSGCASLLEPQASVTGGAGGPSIGQAQAEHYNGPKARIAVLAFDNKTGKGHRIGDGMTDMLATALFNSNRFIVVERRELGGVLAEQDLASSGRVNPATGAATGQVYGAELLVAGAITEFEPNYQGGAVGIVMPRLPLGIGATGSQAHIAIDLRVIDARTSQIVCATSITGRSTDFAGALGTAIGGGRTRTGIGLGAYRNTPVEKAVRVCINKAVEFVVSRTPAQYYHVGAGPAPMPQAPMPAAPVGAPSLPPVGGAVPGAAPSLPMVPAAPPAAPVAPPAAAPAAGNLPQQVFVSLASARIFQKPDASSAAVVTVTQGSALTVVGEQGSWYAVATANGKNGWILKSFTSATK
ncbi:SH3 domain-containing protein [bacterium]|nr:SH3 domain-containing protein [bacterium]